MAQLFCMASAAQVVAAAVPVVYEAGGWFMLYLFGSILTYLGAEVRKADTGVRVDCAREAGEAGLY